MEFTNFYPQLHPSAGPFVAEWLFVSWLSSDPSKRQSSQSLLAMLQKCQGKQKREWTGGVLWQMVTEGQKQDNREVLHWDSEIFNSENHTCHYFVFY